MMSTRVVDQLTVATAVGCGISGGVFFAFSTIIMPALKRLPPSQAIGAMQSINVKAPNPPFMLALFGSALGCVVLAVATRDELPERPAMLRLLAAALYLVGIVLTVSFPMPRNNALAKLDPNAVDSARAWTRYATTWTNANHVRAITSIAAAALLTVASRSA